jgi:heavy metal sensor kinase
MRTLPLRVRLTAWYFLVLGLAFSAFSFLAFFEVRGSIHSAVDEGLRDRAAEIRELLERQLPPERVKHELAEGSNLRGEDDILEIAETNGEWEYSSAPATHFGLRLPTARTTTEKFHFSTMYSMDKPLRVMNGQIPIDHKAYAVLIATPVDEFYEAINRFKLTLLLSVPALLLIASAGAYWLSRKAIAPVGEIARAANSIRENELSKRLPVPQTGDELQSLSETLNELFGRLERAFRRISEFTADASHELRTPVALMRTRTEIALRKPRSETEYRETIVRIHTELERTSVLIENLMTLARADSGSQTVQLTSLDMNEVLQEIWEPARLLANENSIHYEQTLPKTPVLVSGNAALLRRLILILIDNAVKYTQREGRISVVLDARDDAAVTEIHDNGIGISSSDLPHIFERFYRSDASRSRESGGTGLGLSIANWIADAHKGEISVASTIGKGSVFQVRIPLCKDEI